MNLLANQRGSETVEFALIALWFFFVVFLIIETGMMIREYNTIALVAQEGARRGSMVADVAEGGLGSGAPAWAGHNRHADHNAACHRGHGGPLRLGQHQFLYRDPAYL